MAQLVLTTAVRVAATMAAQLALGAVDRLLGGGSEPQSRLDGLTVASASEGRGLPIVYGRMRVAGQVIWASRFSETKVETGGGKGGPSVTAYRYTISFALALCEGPIAGVGRMWADGADLDLTGVNWRLHRGGSGEMADPLIQLIEGETPAYRGVAYLVFEDFPVTPHGDRIPNISVEVIAAGDEASSGMEQLVQGVCLIPGSGEQIYATTPVARAVDPVGEVWENRHQRRAGSDLEAALDDLEARLPACRRVALIVSWFGDDLRCGECRIRPGVETRDAQTHPFIWTAGGVSREAASLVSRIEDRPAYGGTPSDDSVREAIAALKARGFAVTFYPFILMDVPPGSGRPDPSGSGEQPVYPWRGRIRPAADSVDPAGDVAAFFGGANASDFTVSGDRVSYSGESDWRFNRFILHQAALARSAGGVDTFVIGSELVALTSASAGGTYPAAGHLAALAGEVRSLLGPGVQLSYAADWSEYHGVQAADAPGDKRYPLDTLWARPEIDFIGIDWYAPLSDWRDGESHADRAAAESPHARAYLEANVEGGEGFDWYYASAADRSAQHRTPITDPMEPWIWRFKDLRSFWSEPHHERIGGVRSAQPTAWVPESKPVVLLEYGCPAIDKGANQPNVFVDPKSSESAQPHFSSGARDDLIQRRYIEALLGYWSAPGRNPVSSRYGGPMLDLARSCAWTWDARPFPEFPAFVDVWADAENWRLGHWLTGRAGQSETTNILADLCARAGLLDADISRINGVVSGYAIDGPVKAAHAIAELSALLGFAIVDRADGVLFAPEAGPFDPVTLRSGDLAGDRAWRAHRTAAQRTPGAVRVDFIDASADFSRAQITVRDAATDAGEAEPLGGPILADAATAARWGRAHVERLAGTDLAARIELAPSQMVLEPGDAVRLEDDPHGRLWRIVEIETGERVVAELRTVAAGAALPPAGPDERPQAPATSIPPSRPLLHTLELRGESGGAFAAAFAEPWSGSLDLWAAGTFEGLTRRTSLERAAIVGELAAALPPGVEGRWETRGDLIVRLYGGTLQSRSRAAVLSGRGLAAVSGPNGWEVIGFEHAELIEPEVWRLTGFLRRLGGGPEPATAPAGSAFVRLDEAVAAVPVEAHERNALLTLAATPAGAALDDPAAASATLRLESATLAPLSPVHGRAQLTAFGLEASWIRRTRVGGDDWEAREVPLGEDEECYSVAVRGLDGSILHEEETITTAFLLPEEAVAMLNEAPSVVEVAQISRVAGSGALLRIPVLG